MAVQTITYEDKQYLNQNADIPATNKVQDIDMNEIKRVVNNNANEVENIQNGKKYLIQSFSNASCTQNTNNNLASFNLTEGIWIVVGYFFYNGSDLRTYLTITSNNVEEITTSAYDNSGSVAGQICGIINVQNTSNIVFKLLPTGKNITVSGYLKAVKYQ
jgi:hypothetical protein